MHKFIHAPPTYVVGGVFVLVPGLPSPIIIHGEILIHRRRHLGTVFLRSRKRSIAGISAGACRQLLKDIKMLSSDPGYSVG
ncbi:MAG: hypothetical protein CM1200mP39_01320 [Dehalococcoidia bacterium]|nr:MAG: hypothetical protein CM1200mP39_01320 [Dehalococcoidia bacterium]